MDFFSGQDWVTVSGIITGGLAFIAGLWQYREGQRWKRLEFVAKEIKEFRLQHSVKSVILMLDYNEREIELFPEEQDKLKRKVLVTDQMICQALAVHNEKNKEKLHRSSDFSKETLAIRDYFDEYLEWYEKFEQFIASGLVSEKEFEPYLSYDIDIMAKIGRKSEEFRKALLNFINAYDYDGVKDLAKRYNRPFDGS
jgi:hypothetical protein